MSEDFTIIEVQDTVLHIILGQLLTLWLGVVEGALSDHVVIMRPVKAQCLRDPGSTPLPSDAHSGHFSFQWTLKQIIFKEN